MHYRRYNKRRYRKLGPEESLADRRFSVPSIPTICGYHVHYVVAKRDLARHRSPILAKTKLQVFRGH